MALITLILSAELTRFRDRRHRLVEAGDAADEALMLEALRGVVGLRDAIVVAVRSALEDEGRASRLRGRLDEMAVLLRRIERRAEGTREVALRAMAESGLEHLDPPGHRIDVRHQPLALLVSDESLIRDAYGVARPAWLDYQTIRDALKARAPVPGAALAEPEPYLSVRTA